MYRYFSCLIHQNKSFYHPRKVIAWSSIHFSLLLNTEKMHHQPLLSFSPKCLLPDVKESSAGKSVCFDFFFSTGLPIWNWQQACQLWPYQKAESVLRCREWIINSFHASHKITLILLMLRRILSSTEVTHHPK